MYAPKNAYQKLLTMFFGSAPVVAETMPSQSVWGVDSEINSVALASSNEVALTASKDN